MGWICQEWTPDRQRIHGDCSRVNCGAFAPSADGPPCLSARIAADTGQRMIVMSAYINLRSIYKILEGAPRASSVCLKSDELTVRENILRSVQFIDHLPSVWRNREAYQWQIRSQSVPQDDAGFRVAAARRHFDETVGTLPRSTSVPHRYFSVTSALPERRAAPSWSMTDRSR